MPLSYSTEMLFWSGKAGAENALPLLCSSQFNRTSEVSSALLCTQNFAPNVSPLLVMKKSVENDRDCNSDL